MTEKKLNKGIEFCEFLSFPQASGGIDRILRCNVPLIKKTVSLSKTGNKIMKKIIVFLSIIFIFMAHDAFAQEAKQETSPKVKQETAKGPAQVTEYNVVADEMAVSEDHVEISEASGNVSLDFKDADINNVLRIIALKSNINVVSGPEVQGTVTIRLEDVPWDKALDIVLRTYEYVYERDGNIIRVTTKESLTTEELITETFILNYTTCHEAEEAIKDVLSERGRVKSVARTNMLIVTDIPTNITKITEVVRKLDKNTPQAYIDAKIVKTAMQEGENLGIQWSPGATISGSKRPSTFPFANDKNFFLEEFFKPVFPTLASNVGTEASAATVTPNSDNLRGFPTIPAASAGTTSFTFGALDFTAFQATLNFLRSRANTKIISNPRITVLNHQTAKVKVGVDVPIPTLERNETSGSFEVSGFSYRETGVVLEVTPHINNADEILVDLKPEVSSQGSLVSFSSGGSASTSFDQFPTFNVESAHTQVMIKSGETIAVGGLMTDKGSESYTKVPVLGDIPILGKAFRSKRKASGDTNAKQETLFFVTVNVVDTAGEPVVLQAPKVPGKTAVV